MANQRRPLTMEHLMGAFFVIIFGFIAATILCLAEIIWQCRSKWLKHLMGVTNQNGAATAWV